MSAESLPRHMPRLLGCLVAVFVLMDAAPANACTCIGGLPLCETVFTADAVFEGTVESIETLTVQEPAGAQLFPRPERHVRLRDLRPWIGQPQTPVVTGGGGGDCGYTFLVGTRYIISARRGRGGVFTTSICSQTKPIDEAADLLAFLRTLAGPGRGGRVSGDVTVTSALFAKSTPEAVAGVPVHLSGPLARVGITDRAGKFEFSDLPTGDYQLTLDSPLNRPELVPFSSEPIRFSIPNPHACALRSLNLTIDGGLSGSVVDELQRPASKAAVHLRPASPERWSSYMAAEADETGFFRFTRVPPGQYVVGVNLQTGPSQQSPYATAYGSDFNATAPGVVDLDAGEKRALPPIVVRRLSAVRVVGTVRLPDGQPAREVVVLASAWGERKDLASPFATQTKTDGAGDFVFELLRGARYTLRAVTRDASNSVEIVAGDGPATIVLIPRPPIPGRKPPPS